MRTLLLCSTLALGAFLAFGCSSGAAGGGDRNPVSSGGAGGSPGGTGGGGNGGSSLSGGGPNASTGGSFTQGSGGSTTDAALDSASESMSDARLSDARAGDASVTTDSSVTRPVDAGRAADAAATVDARTILPDGAVDPCGPDNPARVPLPTIGSSSFDVRTYGAVGDNQTDNTSALQAALDAATAAGGGVVSVPSGTFLSGPLTVGSGTRLDLASGATLKMLPMASWPAAAPPLLNANNTHDIALTGAGTIEGQGQAWWNALTATPTLARPQEVVFNNSTRVLISGIRLQNPPEEHIWVKQDTNVTITGITIETLAVAGQHGPSNTDGVDVSANGLFFCGNSITCGDDNIAMGGTNLYVAYSFFGVGHGCSIGSITQKGTNGLTVDHMTFNGTTSGIRMKSARDRGGLVQNLTYSNITMTNVENPVYITSYYPSLPTDPTTDPAQPVTATTPYWQNITIQNLTVVGSTVAGIIWGLPEAPISNLTFDKVSIKATRGMQVFHATGVSFIDGSAVTVTTAPAVTTFDAAVTGIATQAF